MAVNMRCSTCGKTVRITPDGKFVDHKIKLRPDPRRHSRVVERCPGSGKTA